MVATEMTMTSAVEIRKLSPSQARDDRKKQKECVKKISLTREAYDKENPCILQVCSYLPSTTTILLIFYFFCLF